MMRIHLMILTASCLLTAACTQSEKKPGSVGLVYQASENPWKGSWRSHGENSSVSVDIDIKSKNNGLLGYVCCITSDGTFIDCPASDLEPSFQLKTKNSGDAATVIFSSAYYAKPYTVSLKLKGSHLYWRMVGDVRAPAICPARAELEKAK